MQHLADGFQRRETYGFCFIIFQDGQIGGYGLGHLRWKRRRVEGFRKKLRFLSQIVIVRSPICDDVINAFEPGGIPGFIVIRDSFVVGRIVAGTPVPVVAGVASDMVA